MSQMRIIPYCCFVDRVWSSQKLDPNHRRLQHGFAVFRPALAVLHFAREKVAIERLVMSYTSPLPSLDDFSEAAEHNCWPCSRAAAHEEDQQPYTLANGEAWST